MSVAEPITAAAIASDFRRCVAEAVPWRDPLDALAPFAEEPFAFALLSDGTGQGRWSYVGRQPAATFTTLDEMKGRLAAGAFATAPGPPFQGGAVALAAYEWGAVLEPRAPQPRRAPWPDLIGGVYDSLLAFDHHRREVWAIGRGGDRAAAASRAGAARALLDDAAARDGSAGPVSPAVEGCAWDRDYPAAAAAVVQAIAAGEIFQANVARGWTGRLAAGRTPFELLRRLLAKAPAPFASYLRLPGLAVVSHSPERFLQADADGRVLTRPIKGTRPRSADPAQDRALAAELLASAKDRAENLMIVDLMRNDLSRGCRPGSVIVPALCTLESFSHVHHLVSTVGGRLAEGVTALDLLASAFPPGSVTGAPKLQAMQVIARHEPPRGPYCGVLAWAGFDGAMDSSVLIRTVALEQDARGWQWEARAGAGVVADSDPDAEDAEAQDKAAAMLRALTEP